MTSASALIDHLDLRPHPEGGWYRETWAASAAVGERPVGTAIYYLLEARQTSHWHRVDADEIWHFYAGDPLTLKIAADEAGPRRDWTLGPDVMAGQSPQILVPKGFWQAARPTGAYTLVGCTVSPGFQFDGFEMAPAGFDIP
ncbi:cupin domain-containing protein [Rhodovulum sp. FJ3]|uniref:cupin domain-containing protein n=1 Tax=Rhodovulum sp. FJ3 TaxID=3079053 RepID=UPI00293DAAF2|nr:cupin domain-containing protein [Rhodovulum sp. FJ3]MDV4166591.1 cupin domain-containing protein [Rhodovulum sp. FJ3]